MANAARLLGSHVARIRAEAEQTRIMRRTLLASYRADLIAAVKTAGKGSAIWSWQVAARARTNLEIAGLSFGRRLTASIAMASEQQFVAGAEAFVGRIVGRKVSLPYLRRSLFSFRPHDVGAFTGKDLARHVQQMSVRGAIETKTVAEMEREIASKATLRATHLADRVIATETTRVMADGALMVASTIGVGVVWDATLDMRTCHECAAMHGRLITPRDERPPKHPRCRCACIPEFTLSESDAGWTAADLDDLAGEMGEPRTSSGFAWWILLAAAIAANRRRKQAEEAPTE